MTENLKEKTEKFEKVEEIFDGLVFEKLETTGGYDDVYFVKAKTKDCAYFEFTKRIQNKTYIDPRTTLRVLDGKLYKIEFDTFNYEGKDLKNYKLYISKNINGKNILFILNLNMTQTGRSIINSLIGFQKSIKTIYLELYMNKSGYTSVKMTINGIKAVWKYSIDEQRSLIETIKNKKGEFVSNDYSELDEKLDQDLKNHMGILFPELEQTFTRIVENSDSQDDTEQDNSIFELETDETDTFFN